MDSHKWTIQIWRIYLPVWIHRHEQYRFEGYVHWENRTFWVPESDWQLEYEKRGKMLWVGRIEWGKANQLASQRVCIGETIRKIIWKLGPDFNIRQKCVLISRQWLGEINSIILVPFTSFMNISKGKWKGLVHAHN